MDQTGDDVRVNQVEVVVRTKDVSGDDRGEVASELLVVSTMVDLECKIIILEQRHRAAHKASSKIMAIDSRSN